MHILRPITYCGQVIVMLPGINVSSISMPSGGVSRDNPVGATVYKRSVSLMIPFRWFKSLILELDRSEPPSRWVLSSSRSFETSSGCFASS